MYASCRRAEIPPIARREMFMHIFLDLNRNWFQGESFSRTRCCRCSELLFILLTPLTKSGRHSPFGPYPIGCSSMTGVLGACSSGLMCTTVYMVRKKTSIKNDAPWPSEKTLIWDPFLKHRWGFGWPFGLDRTSCYDRKISGYL